MLEYRNLIDRSFFKPCADGSTPWDDEPDLVVGLHNGYSYAIIRHAFGHLNGYVCVPPGHKFYEEHYRDVDVSVHGGLTYSGRTLSPEGCEIAIKTPQGESAWWLGFDTAHWGDLIAHEDYCVVAGGTYRNFEYVKSAVFGLITKLFEDDGEGPGIVPEVIFS